MSLNVPLLFVPATPLRLCHGFNRPSLSPPRRALPHLSAGPPPKVKSSYYKNPSKAIEKGGGFYIPGLRGPRLRVAVSVLALTLLTINHLSAGAGVAFRSFQVSETLAATAAFGILATALADISEERQENASATASEAYVATAGQPMSAREDSANANASTDAVEKVAEEVSWSEAVCADLTGATAFAVFSDGRAVHVSGLGIGGTQAGAAVDRVAQEKRAVYIDDTAALPPEVTLPFLPEGEWAVFLVPQQEEIVAFAKEKGDGFDKTQRAWLAQVAVRMARGCRK